MFRCKPTSQFRSALVSLSAVLLTVSLSLGQESTFRFTVLDDKGLAYKELKPEDIRVLVNKKVVRPTSLTIDDGGVTVLILIDVSPSEEKMVPFEKLAADKFIDHVLRPEKDWVGVAKFWEKIDWVHSLSNDFASAKSKLAGIRFVAPPGYVSGGGPVWGVPSDPGQPGGTPLFNILDSAIAAIARSGPRDRRMAILLISDGLDTDGEKQLKDVVKSSITSRVPIYTIAIGESLFSTMDLGSLRKLSSQTGGISTVPKKESKLLESLSSMTDGFRYSYVARLPIKASQTELTEISIEVVTPSLKKRLRVISPKGIY